MKALWEDRWTGSLANKTSVQSSLIISRYSLGHGKSSISLDYVWEGEELFPRMNGTQLRSGLLPQSISVSALNGGGRGEERCLQVLQETRRKKPLREMETS